MTRRYRRWVAGTLLGAALAAACSGNNKPVSGETASASARPEGNNAANNEASSEAGNVDKRIQEEVAKRLDASASEVEVTTFKEAEVPGMTVFRAYVPSPKAGRPGRFSYGVVKGNTIESDRKKATTMVLEAWNYGPGRTVPPERVALVLGVFEGGSREPADALVTQAQVDAMSETQKKVIFLPREATVDGKPAVEYWATSGEVPLWKTTAVINPDRTVQTSREEFWD
uniref:Lipoprotein n=1 Tax=Kofleria flava TaxID=694315 RepID=A0A3S5GXN1_9BACT|nr:hypothetical protein [Kofleria flava]